MADTIAVEADVTSTASVRSAVAAAEREAGPVEVVVNNAGWDDFMPFTDTTEEFWDKILDINFKGALRVVQAVLPGMTERRFGRIVNIGSDGPGRLVAGGGVLRRWRSSPRTPPASSPARPCRSAAA